LSPRAKAAIVLLILAISAWVGLAWKEAMELGPVLGAMEMWVSHIEPSIDINKPDAPAVLALTIAIHNPTGKDCPPLSGILRVRVRWRFLQGAWLNKSFSTGPLPGGSTWRGRTEFVIPAAVYPATYAAIFNWLLEGGETPLYVDAIFEGQVMVLVIWPVHFHLEGSGKAQA